MPNKSLDRWLHPQLEDDSRENQEVSNLSLVQRLNIAIDVTEALDYLHCRCNPPIVHCDLKPSNILLDEGMVAHVGDFGLAKLLPEAISRSFTDSTNSIGLKGSIGYVPPEYAEGSPVSLSGDVYSFGILLLELLTGKSPVDEMFEEGLTLRRFVEMRGAMEIVDPALLLHDNGTIDRWNSVEECSTSLARIGLACTEQAPRDRMCMGDTVAQLRAVKNVFVKKIEITNETQNP
ncbi:putative LRR receptor-like serine/threonine-protein kinase At3g47570 [Curcuma longa]|uniref:putative LRR receptor-like serine/threonine-protein kinase At3g47570 n=1 Tax=Curcuma longa TaxID=136217 RepID=UPI003D9E823C